MENSAIKKELDRLGINKVPEISARTGIKAWTIYRHLDGSRKVSPKDALKYERGLGISKAVLRPDIFGDAALEGNSYV